METSSANSLLLSTEKAAEFIGGDIQPLTLKRWRIRGRGPRYVKLSGKVRYRESDLRQFLESSVIDPAAAASNRNRVRRRQRR